MPAILPIMPALCPMLLVAYYASNYAGIIGRCLVKYLDTYVGVHLRVGYLCYTNPGKPRMSVKDILTLILDKCEGCNKDIL